MTTEQSRNVKDGTPRHVFNMVVRDFDRAAGSARFSGLQTFLVQRAREESWVEAARQERRDAIPFKFDLKDLAEFIGADLSAMYDAWRILVAARVFRAIGEGYFLIQRYFEKWVKPGTEETYLPDHIIKDCLRFRVARKGRIVREKPNKSLGKNLIRLGKNLTEIREKPNPLIEERARNSEDRLKIDNTPLPPKGGLSGGGGASLSNGRHLPAPLRNIEEATALADKRATKRAQEPDDGAE